MNDEIYKFENVYSEFHPIFEQLHLEFASKYQIWRRVEDFGRWLSAGILNPSTQVAATIALRKETRKRTTLLSTSEIRIIREHLVSDSTEDMVL